MKFAICNEIFQNWKLEDAMAAAARMGYSGIEIAPFTLAKYVTDISQSARSEIRESAARIGIEICGIHWVLVQAEGMYLNHSDPAIRQKTATYFCDLVDFCADIGGKVIVVGSPKQRNLLPGIVMSQALDWADETFRPSVKRAESRGVTICFEPLSPAETDFINTAHDAVQFAARFHSPNFQIILDVKAMCSESKPIPEIIQESSPRFAHFHANDRNLKGPGFGDVDFLPIAAALNQVGYTGYVSVEVFKFEEGPEIIGGKSLEYLKRAFA